MFEKPFTNPFTPQFGSLPPVFGGRGDIIQSFEYALSHPGDKARMIMFEGNRGVGKTSLLKYLGSCAEKRGWKTISVNSGTRQVRNSILSELSGTPATTTVTLEPSIGIPQIVEGKLGKMEKTKTPQRQDVFQTDFEKGLSSLKAEGLVIILDEVQSADILELAEISGVYQLLSDKYDLCLLAAGLPGGFDKLLETSKTKEAGANLNETHGCSFLQRGENYTLEPLYMAEMTEMIGKTLRLVPGLVVEEGIVDKMSLVSRGEPFIAQCLGSEAIKHMWIRALGTKNPHLLEDDVEAARPTALESYYHDVLENMTRHLYPSDMNYLRVASEVGDELGEIPIREILSRLGKTAQQCSQTRKRILDSGLVSSRKRGYLNFERPYVYEFAHRVEEQEKPKPSQEWDYNRRSRL